MAVVTHIDVGGAGGVRRLVTRRAYARMRGVEFYAVRAAIAAGRIRLHGGKIDPEEADSDWAANTDPGKGGDAGLARDGVGDGEANGGQRGPTLTAVKTQHEQLRLELTQAELERLRGNTVRREEAERVLAEEGRRLRDAVLRVPVQLAAAVAACVDPQECRRLMNEALRVALAKR